MSDRIYTALRACLDNLPGGYPSTESGIEIRILKKLFTPFQADVFMRLGAIPSSAVTMARKLNISEIEAEETLAQMADRGLLFRLRSGESALYAATSFVVGIYEFNLGRMDKELAEMMAEYQPHIGRQWSKIETKQLRVIPINASIEAKKEVAAYDRIYDLIKDKKLISVSDCICAKKMGLLDHHCSRPPERCVQFDAMARYFIDNGMAREIDQFELLSLIKTGEEHALVLSPMNIEKIAGFCMCCGCCCSFLQTLKMADVPADQINSRYYAMIDEDACTACGTCSERCQVDAVIETDASHKIDEARCIGCGLCIPTCPGEAITLVEKAGTVRPPPKNLLDMYSRIKKDRGLA